MNTGLNLTSCTRVLHLCNVYFDEKYRLFSEGPKHCLYVQGKENTTKLHTGVVFYVTFGLNDS